MAIEIGDTLPEVVLCRLRDGLERIDTPSLFRGKKAVLFGVPGAFTPTCSEKHLPGFVARLDDFHARGIEVYCVAVNDPFVMKAWGKARNVPETLPLLSDGNGDLTRALGLEMDASGSGMGMRSRRYALYADNGVVRALWVETPGQFDASSAEAVLAALPG
ncbi:MAG: peroxiredoxin [Pseudoxanthomonas sp.]